MKISFFISENISNLNFFLFIALILFFSFIFSDFSLSIFEKIWLSISKNIFEVEENSDFFSDFSNSEDSFAEITKDVKIKFTDIAGNEEAKQELEEVVKFLKDPKAFAKLGASVPKGVLLSGPPGTGKTLFAKAIAGESGTPFIKVSGSQFVELLVGIGAARVRELFQTARESKPSIIFIDEIDSIARSRSSNNNMGGGNDEREQTLNQLLTEMDGFESEAGVLVIAATNRPDILDSAIKRPGRFDRQISLNNPTLGERQAILRVHARGKKLDESVSIPQIAQRTIGFSGAELANLLNEAAILAARRRKDSIGMQEINTSIDRILLGLEGKIPTRFKTRLITAFHEIGHAFIGTIVNESIQKVTLIPRANTQGTTWTLPSGSQYPSRQLFINQFLVALSGRGIEELIGGITESSVGAQQDISQLTRSLRTLIVRYAMTQLQELKQEAQKRNLFFLGSDAKQELNNIVDNFTTNFLDITYQELLTFLTIIRPSSERLADELLLAEEINGMILKSLARDYFKRSQTSEILSNSRESSVFDFFIPELRNAISEVEEEVLMQKQKLTSILKIN